MVAVAKHRVATFAGLALRSGIGACLTKAVGDVILCLRLRRMEPLLLQLLPIEAHSPDKSIGVIATREDAVGTTFGSVEMCHSCQIALTAVAIVGIVLLATSVVPVECACSGTTQACIAVGVIIYGVDGTTGKAFKHRQVFMTTNDATVVVTMVGGVRGIADNGQRSRLVHVFTLSVLRTRSCLTHQLGSSVAIQVIHHVLCVVGTGADVHTQIYAPQQFSILLRSTSMPIYAIAVQIDIAGLSVLRVVLRIRRIPLHEDFVFAVAVDIANGTIVRRIGAVAASSRTAQVQLHKWLRPRHRDSRGIDCHAVHLFYHLISMTGIAARVGIARRISDIGSHRCSVAQHVECHGIAVFRAQQSPAHKHTRRLPWHHHKSATQRLHLTCRHRLSTAFCQAQTQHDEHSKQPFPKHISFFLLISGCKVTNK